MFNSDEVIGISRINNSLQHFTSTLLDQRLQRSDGCLGEKWVHCTTTNAVEVGWDGGKGSIWYTPSTHIPWRLVSLVASIQLFVELWRLDV